MTWLHLWLAQENPGFLKMFEMLSKMSLVNRPADLPCMYVWHRLVQYRYLMVCCLHHCQIQMLSPSIVFTLCCDHSILYTTSIQYVFSYCEIPERWTHNPLNEIHVPYKNQRHKNMTYLISPKGAVKSLVSTKIPSKKNKSQIVLGYQRKKFKIPCDYKIPPPPKKGEDSRLWNISN